MSTNTGEPHGPQSPHSRSSRRRRRSDCRRSVSCRSSCRPRNGRPPRNAGRPTRRRRRQARWRWTRRWWLSRSPWRRVSRRGRTRLPGRWWQVPWWLWRRPSVGRSRPLARAPFLRRASLRGRLLRRPDLRLRTLSSLLDQPLGRAGLPASRRALPLPVPLVSRTGSAWRHGKGTMPPGTPVSLIFARCPTSARVRMARRVMSFDAAKRLTGVILDGWVVASRK